MNNEDQLHKDNSFKKLQKNIRTGSSFLAHYYENTRLYTLWCLFSCVLINSTYVQGIRLGSV